MARKRCSGRIFPERCGNSGETDVNRFTGSFYRSLRVGAATPPALPHNRQPQVILHNTHDENYLKENSKYLENETHCSSYTVGTTNFTCRFLQFRTGCHQYFIYQVRLHGFHLSFRMRDT